MLTGVVSSASDSFELESQSTVRLLRAAERGAIVFTASFETSGTPLFMLLVPEND